MFGPSGLAKLWCKNCEVWDLASNFMYEAPRDLHWHICETPTESEEINRRYNLMTGENSE